MPALSFVGSTEKYTARGSIHDVNRDLILASFSAAVKKISSVLADVLDVCACGMIRGPGKGVNENLVGRARTFPHAKQTQVLPGQSLGEEISPVLHPGHAVGIDAVKLGEPFGDCCASRQFRKRGLRAFVLRIYPRARFLALLVLEPAIRIGHDGRSVGVLRVICSRSRWTLRPSLLGG